MKVNAKIAQKKAARLLERLVYARARAEWAYKWPRRQIRGRRIVQDEIANHPGKEPSERHGQEEKS